MYCIEIPEVYSSSSPEGSTRGVLHFWLWYVQYDIAIPELCHTNDIMEAYRF